MAKQGARLRRLLNREEILVCPGVHDPLTAKVAEDVGFDALYMTGYGTSLSKTGYPDAGFVTMSEMVENANNVQETASVPVVADADAGYGNARNVVRTVREYIKRGVAGVHIEDQTVPKRCGHVTGRELVPVEEAVGKITAAADVRDDRDESFVVIARTDARGAVGGSLDTAIDRVTRFVDAGADVAFVEGPTDYDEIERVAAAVDAPLLYNSVGASGTSPHVPPADLEAMGYNMVVYPLAATLATVAAVHEQLSAMAETPDEAMRNLDAQFADQVGDIHEFSGFPQVAAWEEAYMPENEQDKHDESLGNDIRC